MRPANVVGIAGAGAWGVALANAAAAAGRTVILWGRDDAGIRAIATTRRSDRLPGVDLARAVEATSDLVELGRCDAILVAAPAHLSAPWLELAGELFLRPSQSRGWFA